MMTKSFNKIASSTALALLFAAQIASGQSTDPLAAQLEDYRPALTKDIPHQSKRAGSLDQISGKPWKRHPNFHLEIVRQGKSNAELSQALIESPRFQTWSFRQKTGVGTFIKLELADLDIAGFQLDFEKTLARTKNQLVQNEQEFLNNKLIGIPFAVSLSYIESQPIMQGTLNIRGVLVFAVNANGKIVRISLRQLGDSWWMERLGRTLGYKQAFGPEFAQAIAIPSLKAFLSKPENLRTTLQTAGLAVDENLNITMP